MPLPKGVYRADHVGSFLRPEALKKARKEYADGLISSVQLRAVEDQIIDTIVKQELQSGLRSITDGEARRAFFHFDFLKQIGGVEMKGMIDSSSRASDGYTPPRLVVTGKLMYNKPIQVPDFEYLDAQLKTHLNTFNATTKVSIPSPTMLHFRGGRASIDIDSYPDLDDFFADLARIYQEELAALYQAGARFVQLDDTNLAYLCDEKMRQQVVERNDDPNTLPRKYAQLINEAISKRPSDLKIGIHLCRGNYKSQWFATGGYEPVAKVLFQELNVDVYFLEYDDARSGDFAPLRYLPENKIVVLGLMSSKKHSLDDRETVIKRLHEAAAICPKGLDQLCISHQCGFSSTEYGNDLTEEEQWEKVRLEVDIAKEVWGEDLSK
ncbi:hypothetical protein Bhyg_01266 [Pseudolycoriella hygida]|uniref:Cobalamin-independent methionine synthase MetE C-terminal/archaeal domain-containing protein n=1 Tax=Pseudolycoriella hygida TaxID=35572 RepID=A0A9Q0S5D3_9DIPT|nr:hypothetical protein Bhyg_01266 [Pseudolycoriella hygida]